ncbi:archease [Candidatus Woesearchaeota archaeon]|nr:archease [Candidatus Woesearchaeota archaeon]
MEPFHKFLDHTADVFFVAKAETLPQLFEQCALAVEETMVDVEMVHRKTKIKIVGEDKTVSNLLYDFLDDLVFFKDYQQLVFSKFEITIEEKEGKYSLLCWAHGEKIDHTRHDPKVDIKAITRHMFEVFKQDNYWKAQVLVDI